MAMAVWGKAATTRGGRQPHKCLLGLRLWHFRGVRFLAPVAIFSLSPAARPTSIAKVHDVLPLARVVVGWSIMGLGPQKVLSLARCVSGAPKCFSLTRVALKPQNVLSLARGVWVTPKCFAPDESCSQATECSFPGKGVSRPQSVLPLTRRVALKPQNVHSLARVFQRPQSVLPLTRVALKPQNVFPLIGSAFDTQVSLGALARLCRRRRLVTIKKC